MNSSKERDNKRARSEAIQSRICTHLNAPKMCLTWSVSAMDFAMKYSPKAFSRRRSVCGVTSPADIMGQCFVMGCSTVAVEGGHFMLNICVFLWDICM